MKIGARILSDAALNKLLPSNKDIDNQILSIRESAKSYNSIKENNKDNEIWDREFDRHFNNIFSILGGRGSGKTSVLLTLKYKIMNEYSKGDIILPLIVPEKIDTSGSILEWIIGLLGDIVDKTENPLKDKAYKSEYNYESCRKKDKLSLVEKYNELVKQYTYTRVDDYKKILIDQYEGFKDYIDNVKNILDSDQKLIVKFEEFIEELLKKKRNLASEKEPIIFIFFDDVDLSTGRCTEVLNIILRYLSHPNIVVFAAGNYKTFSEVVTINTLFKDNLLNQQMDKCFFSETMIDSETALDNRKILTQDLLKKILPPAFRYYMPVMGEREKAEFIFSTEEDNEDKKEVDREGYLTLYELIKQIFIKDEYNSKYKNFLQYGEGEIIYAYFKIFDDTQRGTMNVYYLLNSMRNFKFNSEDEEYERCLRIKRLLNTIVHSSSILTKYENEIYKIIDIKDNFEDIFIDYRYVENMLHNMSDKNISSIDDLIRIFILANFIENIVVEENKKINWKSGRKVHGADVLYKILNSQNENFTLYPKIEDIQMLLKMYTLISMRISSSNMKNLSDNGKKDYFLGKYFEILDDVIKQKGDIKEFFWQIYRKDSAWVDHKIRIIMYYGVGDIIFLINNIKQLYEKVKRIGINSEELQDMKQELKLLIDRCNENFTNTTYIKEQLKITSKIENFLLEQQMIFSLDINEKTGNYFEKIIDYYEDRILFYENKFVLKKTIYKIPQESMKDFQDNIDILVNLLKENEFVTRRRSGQALEHLLSLDLLNKNYLLYEEMETLRKILKSIQLMTRRIDETIQYLNILLKYIEKNGLEIRKEELLEMKELVDDLSQDCINYIKIKTLMEIRNREEEESIEDEGDKEKETFYGKFSRLRKVLIDTTTKSSSLGFSEYINEVEQESMKVNFNV